MKQGNHLVFALKIQLPHQVFLDETNRNIAIPAKEEYMRKYARIPVSKC